MGNTAPKAANINAVPRMPLVVDAAKDVEAVELAEEGLCS